MSEPNTPSRHPGPAGPRTLSVRSTTLLGFVLVAEAALCLAVLISIWAPLSDLTSPQAPKAVAWWPLGLGPVRLTANTALLVVVVATSGLGSFVHAATSFATYAGKHSLVRSWVPWYLLRSGIGAALAVLVYFLLRGGLFAGGTEGNATNPYGFAGVAGLCGLFSKQATDKLREVFDTILATHDEPDPKDHRGGELPPAAPVVTVVPVVPTIPTVPAPPTP